MQIAQIVLLAGSPQIALLVEIGFKHAMVAGHEGKHSDVELPFVNQQRILDVFLQDHGLLSSLVHLHKLFHLVQIARHVDAVASIGIFSWFEDPYVSVHGEEFSF